MLDKNGKALQIGQTVRYHTRGYKHHDRQGEIVDLVPYWGRVDRELWKNVFDGKYKPSGEFPLNCAMDRMIIAVVRERAVPRLYCPRPSVVEVVG